MNRITRGPEQIVEEIISYIEVHLSEPLTLSAIAKHAGYSVPWLVSLFKKQTGKSILAHQAWLRIEKAKSLLLRTNLSVTEVAFEVGYNSYTRFSIAFKKATNTSPSGFRTNTEIREPAESDIQRSLIERFRDSFSSPHPKTCWKKNSGDWWQENGKLLGKSEEELSIICTLPLPENFVLTFEFCFFSQAGLSASDLHFILHAGNRWDFYVNAAIGRENNTVNEFIHAGIFRSWDSRPLIVPGTWQTMRVELSDDTCKIALDNNEIFEFRDPFPPSYAKRCFFAIQSWQSFLGIKNLAVYDLGFAALLPAVRQADSLFNNGVFDQAKNAYQRLLASATDPIAIAELHYKIGMCSLRCQLFSDARNWFGKITALGNEEFWARQAKLAELEVLRLLGDFGNFKTMAQQLFPNPSFRDAVRAAFERAANERQNKGFLQDALDLFTTCIALETPGTYNALRAECRIPDLLSWLRRDGEAIEHSKKLLRAETLKGSALFQLRSNYASHLAGTGRFAESEDVIQTIRDQTTNKYQHARCDILHAFNLRGRQRFEDAIGVLESISGRYPGIEDQSVFAQLVATHLYCQIGQSQKAKTMIARISDTAPKEPYLVGYYKGYFCYAPYFVAGEYQKAAELLIEAASPRQAETYTQGLLMIEAGFCFELANDHEKATATWRETARRLPPAQCLFLGTLAERLAMDDWTALENLPYPGTFRSEIFFLAGKGQLQRGNSALARRYFQAAVADDPTLNWFTWLAKKELDS